MNGPELSEARVRLDEWDRISRVKKGRIKARSILQRNLESIALLRRMLPWKISIYDIGAVLALVHGLGTEEIGVRLNPFKTLQIHHPDLVVWRNDASQLKKGVSNNICRKIEASVFKKKGIISTEEIKSAVKPEAPKKGLDAAMQLLLSAGLIKREPTRSLLTGRSSTYSHAEHGDLPLAHKNILIELLEAISEKGGMNVSTPELFKPRKDRAGGNPASRFNLEHAPVRKLEELGLIRTWKEEFELKRGGTSVERYRISLTPRGRTIVNTLKQNGRKSFSELRALFSR